MALLQTEKTTSELIKSPLDVVLEQSKQQLTALRAQLADKPEELSKKERLFMIKECAKLECLGDMQTRLEEYLERHRHTDVTDKAKEARKSGNSAKLGNHLRAAGQFKHGSNWQAHHIVCSRHSSHAASRLRLFAFVGINDPVNGCWLPQKHTDAKGTKLPNALGHAYIHTNAYAKWVGNTMQMVSDKGALKNRLNKLRMKLQNGKQHKDVVKILSDKGKADLFPT